MNNPASRFRHLRAWLGRVPLTREGLLWFVVALALLLMGLLKGINLVILLASVLVVLVAWNWWEARRQLRPVRAERLEDEPAFATTPFRWAVRLSNAGRRTVGGIDVRDGDGPTRQRWFVTEITRGAAILLRGEVTYPRRGSVKGQPLTVESGHPLGLVRVEGQAQPAQSRIVLRRALMSCAA